MFFGAIFNPETLVYESDVQSALFAKLREEINRDVDVDGIDNTKKYKLNLIHTEYLQSIDICCLDFDAISPIKDIKIYKSNNGHDDFIYQLPVLLAIELKFVKGERCSSAFLGTLKDKEKIINSDKKHIINKYICICFIQSEEVLKKHETNKRIKVVKTSEIVALDTCYVVSPNGTYILEELRQ